MKIVKHSQDSAEWLVWRNHGLGASDAATILGRNPYKTPWRLWSEKTGYAVAEDLSANPNVRRGKREEDNARQEAEKALGQVLIPVCAEHDTNPFIRASFDGLTSGYEPVELKCPTEKVFQDVVRNEQQSEAYKLYELQVQWQMIVSGSAIGYLGFYDAKSKNFLLFKIVRDPEIQKELQTKAREFWDLVQSKTEPVKDPERDTYLPLGDDAIAFAFRANRYRTLKAQYDALMAEAEPLKKQMEAEIKPLQQMVKDSGFMSADYAGVSLTSFVRAGTIDYAAIVKDKLDLTEEELESYRKKSAVQWRTTVRKDTVMPKNVVDADVAEALVTVTESVGVF